MLRFIILSVLLTNICQCQISVSRHLRQSPLELLGHDISSDSDTTNHHIRRVETEGKKQRVVLVAGPHKTASSSEQYNIIRWLNDTDDRFLPGWSWPAPTIYGEMCGSNNISMNKRPKIFYAYIGTLNGRTGSPCLTKWYTRQGMTGKNLTHDYEKEFRDSWSKRNSLIIASEAMDFVSTTRGRKDGNKLLNRILDGMPWNSYDDPADTRLEGSNDDITVVVHFRAPRVDHLVSLWHQCCMDTMSFRDYLVVFIPGKRLDKMHSLDSLRLVEVFLEKNLEVTLLDMSGISFQGYDISNILACDVLDADCTSNKTVVGDPVTPSKRNVKDHSHGGTDSQMEEMEQIIRNYDCNYQNITKNEKLTILYPKELDLIFSNCTSIEVEERIMTFEVMVRRLSEVAQHFEAIE